MEDAMLVVNFEEFEKIRAWISQKSVIFVSM